MLVVANHPNVFLDAFVVFRIAGRPAGEGRRGRWERVREDARLFLRILGRLVDLAAARHPRYVVSPMTDGVELVRVRVSRLRAFLLLGVIAFAAACANSANTAPESIHGVDGLRGIDFVPELLVMESFPVQLAGTVRITNRRERGVNLTFPNDCIALLRVYDRQGTRNAPVWDQRGAPACHRETVTLDVPPGGTVAVRVASVSAYEILGDSLPDGSYRATLYLQPNGQVVEAEAGSVDLAVPRQGGV